VKKKPSLVLTNLKPEVGFAVLLVIHVYSVNKGLSNIKNRMIEDLLIRRMGFMGARVLLGGKGITLLAILWVCTVFSGEFGCSKKVDVSEPEDWEVTYFCQEKGFESP